MGQTFGMLILQDFEAITPNILAQTIETVQGGGMVIMLLKTMTSLTQLYNMSMDVHKNYITESHSTTRPRFNERFLLSLGSCDTCLILDDTLNILPISGGKNIVPYVQVEAPENTTLKELQGSLKDTVPIGPLVGMAKTQDQAQALLSLLQ